MNHHQPYRPHASQIPADLIRADTRDTRRHVPSPLKRLPGTRAAGVSYRALAPGGAGFCYRICTGTSESRLTAHYSLLTANSTYTFSAKERDSETGLSYFGSRYYSSDLSIWLSVDPMSDKYPSLSPYVYCADNPVRLVDPNGDTLSPSALFRQSSYFKVYQNLLQSNNTYKRLIADYQGERCHFYFDFSYEMTKRAGSTVWQHKTEGSKVSVTTHSTYYRPDGGDQSEIAMAKTLIHEAVHAFDGLTQRKTPNHDGFDQASVLAGLKEYNSIFNLGYSDEDLEILSWSGLQKSKEYKSFINSRAKENERSYDEEDTYVKTKMTILMFGTVSDD